MIEIGGWYPIAGMNMGSKGRSKSTAVRSAVISQITTPLGFYVLALLIVESTLCIVLTTSKLSEERIWSGFLWMISVFIGVVIVVTLFACFNPRHLLYGKDEHSDAELEWSALKDQIEDLIAANVKSECLKKTAEAGE